jgi:hypothetical protein
VTRPLDIDRETLRPRLADTRLRRQVDHGVGTGEDIVEVDPGKVELEAPEAVPLGKPGGVGALDRRVGVIGEGVDAIDVVTASRIASQT